MSDHMWVKIERIGNTCVDCVSCGIYIYMCVSTHVQFWQIHYSKVNGNFYILLM